jgi:hypothetical protein
MRFWLLQVLIAIDQLANALLGGWADETLSSHAHRRHPRLARVIDALFWFDPEHCRAAFESERFRLQAPPESR